MINKDLDCSNLSTTMIKELFNYDNEISINSFWSLTTNRNVRYIEYLANDNFEFTLLDNSKITVIINKLCGDG